MPVVNYTKNCKWRSRHAAGCNTDIENPVAPGMQDPRGPQAPRTTLQDTRQEEEIVTVGDMAETRRRSVHCDVTS